MTTESDNPEEDDPVENPDQEDTTSDAAASETTSDDAAATGDSEAADGSEASTEAPDEVPPQDGDAISAESTPTEEPEDPSLPRLYDFHHPQHRLGDPLPQFKICGKKIASEVSSSVVTDLHVEASVELVNTRYAKHTDFVSQLNDDVSVFRSDISPFSLDMLIVMERGLLESMVDSFFGGSVTSHSETVRGLSQTERRFATRLRSSILDALQLVCGECFTMHNHGENIVTAEELKSVGGHETRVLALQEFEVTASDQTHQFYIVYPWSAVESLTSLSDEHTDTAADRQRWTFKLTEHVSACAVELQGKLAETEVTVSQLLDMQKGDFIPLGEVGPATFTVDNTPIFDASIGASNGFVSASILQWSIEGDARHE